MARIEHGTPEQYDQGCVTDAGCPAYHEHGMSCRIAHNRFEQGDHRYQELRGKWRSPKEIAKALGISRPLARPEPSGTPAPHAGAIITHHDETTTVPAEQLEQLPTAEKAPETSDAPNGTEPALDETQDAADETAAAGTETPEPVDVHVEGLTDDCHEPECGYPEPHRHGLACDRTCPCGLAMAAAPAAVDDPAPAAADPVENHATALVKPKPAKPRRKPGEATDAEIRAWCRENGLAVGKGGPIPGKIVAAFNANDPTRAALEQPAPPRTAPAPAPGTPKAIRAWAAEHGITVRPYGMVPTRVRWAYEANDPSLAAAPMPEALAEATPADGDCGPRVWLAGELDEPVDDPVDDVLTAASEPGMPDVDDLIEQLDTAPDARPIGEQLDELRARIDMPPVDWARIDPATYDVTDPSIADRVAEAIALIRSPHAPLVELSELAHARSLAVRLWDEIEQTQEALRAALSRAETAENALGVTLHRWEKAADALTVSHRATESLLLRLATAEQERDAAIARADLEHGVAVFEQRRADLAEAQITKTASLLAIAKPPKRGCFQSTTTRTRRGSGRQ